LYGFVGRYLEEVSAKSKVFFPETFGSRHFLPYTLIRAKTRKRPFVIPAQGCRPCENGGGNPFLFSRRQGWQRLSEGQAMAFLMPYLVFYRKGLK
jgi:hypothetical protein